MRSQIEESQVPLNHPTVETIGGVSPQVAISSHILIWDVSSIVAFLLIITDLGGGELVLVHFIALRHFPLGKANQYQGIAMIKGAN
jgi:hypothetical protein